MMFIGPMFNGLRLILTKRGRNEMELLGLNGWDIVEVLCDGWDCSRSKRHKGTMERCLEQGCKVIRAVAIKGPYDMEGEIEEAYYLIHVSIEAKRRRQHTQDGDRYEN